MNETQSNEILNTIEDVYDEIRNKQLFQKHVLGEVIAYLIGNENYSELDYIIDTDHSLLLSANNKTKDQVALKIYIAREDKYGNFLNVINQIQVQNKDIFQNIVRIDEIKIINLSNDMISLYIEEEICGQSLLDLILEYKSKNLEIEQETKLRVAIKILDSLNYLHQQQLSHNNIKLSNILTQSKLYKLSDLFLNIHDLIINASIQNQQQDQESIQQEQEIKINNYAFKSPEYNLNKTTSAQSDLFTVGIILLQLDNIQKFQYQTLQQLQNDETQYFQLGIIPPNLQLQTESIFYKCAISMINKQPNERHTSSYYLEKFMNFLKEKKMNMGIRVDSLDVDYQRIIDIKTKKQVNNSQTDSKRIEEQFEEQKDEMFLSSQIYQDEIEEEEKDKFEDKTQKIDKYDSTQFHNINIMQDQSTQKKSSFYAISRNETEENQLKVDNDSPEEDNNELKEQEKRTSQQKNLLSPTSNSLNISKLQLSSKRSKQDSIQPPQQKVEQKSKFSTFQQLNQTFHSDEDEIQQELENSCLPNDKSRIKSIEQNQPMPMNESKSNKQVEDEQSHNKQESNSSNFNESQNIRFDQKRESQSIYKLSSQNIFRKGSDDIQRQFDENQKKLSMRKQLQGQKSSVSSDRFGSPVNTQQSPQQIQSQKPDQKNEIILFHKSPQNKFTLQNFSYMDSQQHSQFREDEEEQLKKPEQLTKIKAVENVIDKIKEDEIKQEEIELQEIEEEQKQLYTVCINWNQEAQKSQKQIQTTEQVELHTLMKDIDNVSTKLQSLTLDFTKYKYLNGPTLLSIMEEIEKSSKTLKKLDLNLCDNNRLQFAYVNIMLEKMAEQKKYCFFLKKNSFNFADLNLKINTPAMNTFLIRDILGNQCKSLIKLNIYLGNQIEISNTCTEKIFQQFYKCKNLDELSFKASSESIFENHKAIKLKRIKHVCLSSNIISYYRFTKTQSIKNIMDLLQMNNQDVYNQDTLKIRIVDNTKKFGFSSFQNLVNFIGKFKFMKKLTLGLHSQNLQVNQGMDQLVKTLASLDFLTDVNIKFDQYTLKDYSQISKFLKLKDAKIFMKNIIIFNYTGFQLSYVKRHLKALNKSIPLKVLSLKIPQVLSVDEYLIQFIANYFYSQSIEIIEIETSQFNLARYTSNVCISISGVQVLIDKTLKAVITQGKNIEELTLTYQKSSQKDSIEKVLPLLPKLLNLKEVQIQQVGWINMKWMTSILEGLKTVKNIKYIFLSNPSIQARFNNNSNLQIISNEQKSLEAILDYFDVNQNYFEKIKSLQIECSHKLLFNTVVKLRLINLLLTLQINILLNVEHVNLENIDEIFEVSNNEFYSENMTLNSKQVTSLISTSKQNISLNMCFIFILIQSTAYICFIYFLFQYQFQRYEQLNQKNQQIICNSFSQFENITKLTLDLRQLIYNPYYQ